MASEDASPTHTPVPERKRGLQRAKMAAAAAAAAAEQVCEPRLRPREGFGERDGRVVPTEGGDEGVRAGLGRPGEAEWGGRAGRGGGSCPQPRCWPRPGGNLDSR